jgi:hypothetical protein
MNWGQCLLQQQYLFPNQFSATSNFSEVDYVAGDERSVTLCLSFPFPIGIMPPATKIAAWVAEGLGTTRLKLVTYE